MKPRIQSFWCCEIKITKYQTKFFICMRYLYVFTPLHKVSLTDAFGRYAQISVMYCYQDEIPSFLCFCFCSSDILFICIMSKSMNMWHIKISSNVLIMLYHHHGFMHKRSSVTNLFSLAYFSQFLLEVLGQCAVKAKWMLYVPISNHSIRYIAVIITTLETFVFSIICSTS